MNDKEGKMALLSSKNLRGLVQRCSGGVRRNWRQRQGGEKEQTVGDRRKLWNQGNKALAL